LRRTFSKKGYKTILIGRKKKRLIINIKEIKKAFPTLQLDVRNKKTYNQYKAWNGKHRIF